MLKDVFINLLKNYTSDNGLIDELWTEMEEQHANPKRHYHTLQHLENLFIQLTKVKNDIQDWDTVLFTLFYHDAIYLATKSDNEEKSAELAEKRLSHIGVSRDKIERCKQQILATKSHIFSEEDDTNFFTDADLSVLGQDWDTYANYFKNVRKEYAIYPNFIYKKGRKKVLNHFLTMDRIYKTDFFYKTYETQAKRNISKELTLLEM
ncbi:MAG: hypothetical protein H6607_04305 [Flavobacteriales bacterium]|nr:hypothetical protein [Flavobacteriales bacterium]